MKATQQLHELGQSIWLDNITRAMLDSGQLRGYIDDYSVTGLTSNPTIFDKAIGSGAYGDSIREHAARTSDSEALFFELAIEDLRRAADAFAAIHERTAGVDGWVSLEVSPKLAYEDAAATTELARTLHEQAGRENLLIKIPGTSEGLQAIEQSIAAGIPINVTLLFSPEQYRAAADAFMRGIEAGENPVVGSVASVFMSRWDVAVQDEVPGVAARPARARGRAAGLPRLPRADRLRALAAARERRRTDAAAAVGEHEHQGPASARRPLPARARRAVHRQHRPRADAAGVLRPRPRR